MPTNTGAWGWETRMLFRVAMVIFTVTALIGIFNSFHFVTLSPAVLLTHVHAGTLGWITLSAFAAAYWLYGSAGREGDGHARGVAIAMAVAVPLYVLAFLSGNFVLRAVFGTPVLVIIVGLVFLLLRTISAAGMTAPRLGMLLAFVTLIIGSTLGVLIQVQLAISHTFLPAAAVGGHASAQVGGYLVLFALSAIDWRLKDSQGIGWAAGVQIGLLFLSGVALAAGVLLSIQPLLGAFIPMEIIAMVIFLFRVGPRVAGARWTEAGSSRHYAIGVPWIIVNLGLTIYVVIIAVSQGFDKVPFNLLIAGDHAIFIGVMTNMVFGLVQDFTADRRDIWPFTENVVFWVMNVALTGFVLSLITNAQWAEKFFVPFQGLAILVGIVAYSLRLAAPADEAPTPLAAAAAG